MIICNQASINGKSCRTVYLSGHFLWAFQSDRWKRTLNDGSLWIKTCFLLETKKKKILLSSPESWWRLPILLKGHYDSAGPFAKVSLSLELIRVLGGEERGNPWGVFKVTSEETHCTLLNTGEEICVVARMNTGHITISFLSTCPGVQEQLKSCDI